MQHAGSTSVLPTICDEANGTSQDSAEIWKRLFSAADLVQKTAQEMALLDVNYQTNMREVQRLRDTLNGLNLATATREEIDAIFDQMENELHKTIVKTKALRAKKTDKFTRENLRRSERESRSQSVGKGRGRDSPTPSASLSEQSLSARRKRMRAPETTEGRPMQKKRGAGRPRLPRKRQASCIETEAVLETDQSEEVYCLCRQISYGDMICCDNKKCDEWFHFPCVQLRVKPKGNWYCPHCRGDRCDVINPDLEE